MSSTTVYVAPEGDDRWSGGLAEPAIDGSDGPVASLERARELARAASGPTTVLLRGGDYLRSVPFTLGPADKGVRYAAYPGERPRLLGGPRLDGFAPLSDVAILERLDPAARSHVLVCDLRANGLTDLGMLRPRGWNRPPGAAGFGSAYYDRIERPAAHLEIFFDGRPLTLARWPNEGFAEIGGYVQPIPDQHGGEIGALEAGFHYTGDRPERWRADEEIWLHGYWAWDWANSYERVAQIDLEQRLIRTEPPHGHYGFRVGGRYYALNILEELDAPGEYYVDHERGKLYLWPPDEIEGTEVLASLVEEALIQISAGEDLTISGLVLEAGRGAGVMINGGRAVTIENCTLRNLGSDGVVVLGGREHRVRGCEVEHTGDAGIIMAGGDRATLEPCDHVVEANTVCKVGRWSRTYCPAIQLAGVGLRASDNHLFDLPHAAILYQGNNIIVEYNHIHHYGLETGDVGAIYSGRDFTTRGNHIRYNYLHDSGGVGMGSMGVYLDDILSGQEIYGNLFIRVANAVFIGGGPQVNVENNLFVDCTPAVWVDARGADHRPVWRHMLHSTMRRRYAAVNASGPIYRSAYPELAELELDAIFAAEGDVFPIGVRIARNICVGEEWLVTSQQPSPDEYLTLEANLIDASADLSGLVEGAFQLWSDGRAEAMGFVALPLSRMFAAGANQLK
jgi:hypothetical protein